MFRFPNALRAKAPRGVPNLRRSYSSQTSANASRTPIIIGAVVIGGVGIYSLTGTKAAGSSNFSVPVLDGTPPSTESTVKVLDFAQANAKIREQAHSYVFDAHAGKGRVDIVRVTSNNPTEDEWDVRVGAGIGAANTLFVGVYDGHAGWATSAVLRKALIPTVSNALVALNPLASNETVTKAIKTAFKSLDDTIMNSAVQASQNAVEPGSAAGMAALAPAIAGSCALMSIYDSATSSLRTAVTGDSRAVLGEWSAEEKTYAAHALSKDQTGFNQDEVERLDKLHPGEMKDMIDPKSGRMFGIAITRAFGDHRWKYPLDVIKQMQGSFFAYAPRPNYKTSPYMTAEPEVTTRNVATDDFLILASDGLWDVISNEDAVACVSRWLVAKRAGKPESVTEKKSNLKMSEDGAEYKATPEFFAIEDLDNAAVCLVKNALGGNRRGLFTGIMTAYSPISRYVRDDITVQVVFFKDPHA